MDFIVLRVMTSKGRFDPSRDAGVIHPTALDYWSLRGCASHAGAPSQAALCVWFLLRVAMQSEVSSLHGYQAVRRCL